MNGKIVVGGIVLTAAIVGAGIYFAQVYAYYYPVEPSSADAVIRLQPVAEGVDDTMLVSDFQGIDAESSPLRFRACFVTPMTIAMLSESYKVALKPTPLIGPSWFECFDAGQIGKDLESGAAVAFVSQENIHPGVDRIVAVYPDGRAYAWQQLNESAEK